MEQALYGPAGYYSTGTAKSGKAGDYFTAPDVGKVFGQLLAETFQNWKERLGEPDFQVVEAGAGEGRLAADILASRPFPYRVIDKSSARRRLLESNKSLKVEASLKDMQPFTGVLFGNELIDAFPVHRVQSTGGQLRELYFDDAKRKFLWKEPSSPSIRAYFKRLKIDLPEGYETEVNLAMSGWLKDASRALHKGLVLLIDYGRPALEYYDPERSRGTLRAFSKHKVSADFLDPNSMVDLTADVDFTSLALDAREAGFVPLAFMEMGTFLMKAVEGLMAGGLEGSTGLKYLIHPEGMGGKFHVLILGKDLDPAAWSFEHNRIGRLGLKDL